MITDAFRLDGKFALITGASKGIGAGIATTFAEMGADVALLARSEDALTEVADAIQQLGREALCLPCDITDDSAIPGAIAAVEQRFGRLDILINNAGGPGKGYGSLEQVDRER
ncbi:MAG: SDR family NAD(P)-dependent oxidoreductase, partial [Halieaceae bacterium]